MNPDRFSHQSVSNPVTKVSVTLSVALQPVLANDFPDRVISQDPSSTEIVAGSRLSTRARWMVPGHGIDRLGIDCWHREPESRQETLL